MSVTKTFGWSLILLSFTVPLGRAAQATQRVPDLGNTATSPERQLDLNTASAAELKRLPGMGDAYVKRVIEGRPYTAKNQLVTRGILPQEAYDRIRELIIAHRVVRTQ